MNDIISYLPVLGYFAFASIMFIFRKFIFGLHASVLIIAMVINTYLNLSFGGSILITVLQIFFAVVSFVLMVPFFAGKASGETMLAFTALVGLAPFPRFFLFSLVGFGLSIALFIAFAAFMHRDKIGDLTDIINNTEEAKEEKYNPGNVKDMLTVGTLSTYNGQFKLPDYSYLPDASSVKKEERFSFSIFALAGYGLVVAFNLVNALFFLDN
jgi:hypothetical protein